MDDETRSRLRHEARTPLNHIIGYSELVADELADRGQKDLLPDLAKIREAAERLFVLIDGILSGDVGAESRSAFPEAKPNSGALHDSPAELRDGEPLLVVDDNADNRDMLSRRLRARGYRVDLAENGQAALDLVASRRYALILLDVVMPGMSGLDVLAKVRETFATADLPIVMATARDDSADVVLALKLGANDYVTKPLDFPVVLARVETQLSLKAAKASLDARNRFILKTFGRYLSDEVVAGILESPDGLKLGGEKRRVTILMSDLRGFTPLCERLLPEQVVALINNYLGEMTEVILRFDGTIDEFIGDAVLAIFGAPHSEPDDAVRAAACALAMQEAMAKVNDRNRREGLPALEMGIALNTGEVVVGNIGSFARAKYGVVGVAVNVAARIQSRAPGGRVLVSAATRAAAGDRVVVGERTEFHAKGIAEPVETFELASVSWEPSLPRNRHDATTPRRQ